MIGGAVEPLSCAPRSNASCVSFSHPDGGGGKRAISLSEAGKS